MGKIALGLKINLAKIDMARVFNGKDNAQYLDMTIFVNMDELDQYGNSGMITQDVSKEEKANNVKGNILGNGKIFWVEGGQVPLPQGQASQAPPPQQQRPQQQGGFQQQQPQQQQQQQQPQQQQQQQQQAPQTWGNQSHQQQVPQQQGGFIGQHVDEQVLNQQQQGGFKPMPDDDKPAF